MKGILRNLGAVIVGVILGSAVNMLLVVMSGKLIPPPAGADVTSHAGLEASIHLFEPRHFVLPFLAHALGTLFGAAATAAIAGSHQRRLAMVIGVIFLAGGFVNAAMLPAPLWFEIIDLVCAYVPMAWLGWKLVTPRRATTG